jgi:SmpA / OmlA family
MIFRFGRIKMIAAVLITTVLMAGGALSQGLSQIQIGMTKQEVVQVLGSPTSASARGGTEILKFNLFSGWGSTAWYQDYYVQLVKGRVTSYGQ